MLCWNRSKGAEPCTGSITEPDIPPSTRTSLYKAADSLNNWDRRADRSAGGSGQSSLLSSAQTSSETLSPLRLEERGKKRLFLLTFLGLTVLRLCHLWGTAHCCSTHRECLDQKAHVLTAINNTQPGAKTLQSPGCETPGHLQLCTTTGLYKVEQITKDTSIHYPRDEIGQTKKLRGEKDSACL